MTTTSLRRALGSGLLLIGVALFQPLSSAGAVPAPVPLGTAGTFSVLAGSTVTNTGPTVVSGDAGNGGDLGVSPGSAVTGFPPGTVNPPGTIHVTDAVASNAQADLTIAYNTAAGLPCDQNLSGQDLGGLTLTTGVYCFDSSAFLTGTLTLDAEGNPDAVFIFQMGSTLITASNSTVAFVNGGQACHVFWQVGSSATLGTASLFSGTVMALTSITVNTATEVQGRLLARNGAVTLDSNLIHTPACAPVTGVPAAPLFGAAGQGVAVGMFVAGAGLILVRRRSLHSPTAR
jgi:Ice-binding-like